MSGLEAAFVADRDGFSVDVAFRAEAGSITALVGPNGAGKSTVIDVIAGLLPSDHGHVRLDGVVLDDRDAGIFVPPRQRGIGVVFQDRVLFPHLSVAENVAFGLTAKGRGRREAMAEAREMLDAAGLEDIALRRANDLSGGEARRVAVARAFAMEPRALLFDEPFASLDIEAKIEVRRQIVERVEGFVGPVLLVTHDPSEAFLLADTIHVIEAGRISQTGAPDEIRLRPGSAYATKFAGVNLMRGELETGVATIGTHQLVVADTVLQGPVVVSIQPSAVAVHRTQPSGSPRNAWRTRVDAIESLGDRVRLHVGSPLPLTVEVTPGAVDALDLTPGIAVWLSVKATEIGVQPG